jgi:group II intron reverse transcriptase/maturase
MSDVQSSVREEGAGEAPSRVLAAQLDLRGAWARVLEKGGMPGVDGVSVSRFARAAEAALSVLQSRLARGDYRPLPLRLAELEKKSGGRRVLLVPAVVDRVVQSAVAGWLGTRWNPGFDQNSYAYRPGRGVHDALRALADLRDRGFRWVLDADISGFFDSIDHGRLLALVASRLGSRSPMLGWIRDWLDAAVWDGRDLARLAHGVPQGSPLSPLLANLFLDPFDRRLREAGAAFIRYADDFVVLARTPFDLAGARVIVERALGELGLSLNEEKTGTTSFERRFRFLGAEVRADAILVPLDRPKTKSPPVFVAPTMPPALRRAYAAGRLVARAPFEQRARVAASPAPVAAAGPYRSALTRLAGRTGTDPQMRALRGRLT